MEEWGTGERAWRSLLDYGCRRTTSEVPLHEGTQFCVVISWRGKIIASGTHEERELATSIAVLEAIQSVRRTYALN